MDTVIALIILCSPLLTARSVRTARPPNLDPMARRRPTYSGHFDARLKIPLLHYSHDNRPYAARFRYSSGDTLLREIFLGQRGSGRLGLHHDARHSPAVGFPDRLNAVDAARDLLAIAAQRVAAP